MKALIVGLLSLTILSACATIELASTTVPEVPPAGQGFCASNDGIFVILINDEGEQSAFACPKIGSKPINQVTELPPGLVEAVTTKLGKAKKLKLPDDPDPCIVWTDGLGTRYAFCW